MRDSASKDSGSSPDQDQTSEENLNNHSSAADSNNNRWDLIEFEDTYNNSFYH